MPKTSKPKHIAEIAYARASIRNLIEQDKSGDTTDLQLAISFLNQAESKCQSYRWRDPELGKPPAD